MVRRSRRVKPAAAVRAASSSISGHGRSGLTWSGVSGETPPQSSIPARRIVSYWSPTRLGGAWIRALAPSTSRVTAIVAARSSSSASGTSRILVSGLARKFCTMTSWMPEYSRATLRMAKTESARSASVSPMPMRMPVVNGTLLRPASSRTRSRTDGSLSGLPKCGPPFCVNRRVAVVSSIMPMDGATGLSRWKSCQDSTPGLRWGSSPVSSSTRMAMART